MSDYIPDITQRYPDGFNPPSPPWEDYYEDDIEIPYESEPQKLEVGMEIRNVEFDGGVTVYKIIRITKDRKRAQCSERWFNVDGTGKRPASWHDIETENGNERLVI